MQAMYPIDALNEPSPTPKMVPYDAQDVADFAGEQAVEDADDDGVDGAYAFGIWIARYPRSASVVLNQAER